MEIRIGTTIKSTKNVVAQYALPLGFQLVVFSQREGGFLGYIYGPGNGPPESVFQMAERIVATFIEA